MLTIRLADNRDRERVCRLWSLTGVSAADDEEWYSITHGPTANLFIAVYDREVIGSVVVSFDGWRAFLYHVAVHPAFRGLGIARALMKEAEKRLSVLGARRLYALVDSDNTPGIGLCVAMGFEPEHDMAFVKELVPEREPSAVLA
jgi:ribosomal protein S18 acetylase RimI-like enzyme